MSISSADIALVTGATGFIGRRLVERLLDDGRAVRALALPDERCDGLRARPVELVRGDVADAAAVAAAARGARLLFHLAAVVGDWGAEALHQRVTVGGTRNLLAAAEPGARVVLASSIVVYGDRLGRDVCDEDHPHGRARGPYSRAKQAQERIAKSISAERGLSLVIVRPGNVYGPGSRPWVHDVLAQLRRGRPTLVGGGRGDAGLAFVDNVAHLMALAAASPRADGRVYNACDDAGVTWARYFGDLARAAGAPPPRSLPRPIAAAAALACEGAWRILRRETRPPITREALNLVGAHHRVPIDRARAELGFAPRVDYQAGMRATATYVRGLPDP